MNLLFGSKQRSYNGPRTRVWTPILIGLMLSLFAGVSSANPVLATDYPERYVVVDGDTLWGISGRFLRDPWRWPEVWQGNPQVNNPDLIYPGDVLVMTFINGRPVLRSLRRETIKLSPKPRVTSSIDAIPPIDPSSIQAYINAPLVTDENELQDAAYIVDGVDSRLLMGKYDQFYGRGFNVEKNEEGELSGFSEQYRIFRPGRRFIDPVSKEKLGWEAVHLGDANMLKQGDPARLVVTKGYNDITIRDRLRPVEKKTSLPFFYPKAPNNDKIRGVILETPNRAAELGALSVIAMNLGEREGVNVGDVFRVMSKTRIKKDPVTGERYSIPEEKIGLAMVFRAFEKVSYALVTDSSRQIEPGDSLVSPNAE